MIVWTPIAVDEKPFLRGKGFLPPYSATVIGTSVVLRMYGGGITSLSFALTTISQALSMPLRGSKLIGATSRIRLKIQTEILPTFDAFDCGWPRHREIQTATLPGVAPADAPSPSS